MIINLEDKVILNSPIVPKTYGFPKIHKNSIPSRPIVNTTRSPHKLQQRKLKPLVVLTSSFIKDSTFFLDKIKDIHIANNSILLNFEVTSIYMMILSNEVVDLVEGSQTTKQLRWLRCGSSLKFLPFNEIYEQRCNVSMG